MQTANMANDDDEVLVAAGIGADFVGPKGLGPTIFGQGILWCGSNYTRG